MSCGMANLLGNALAYIRMKVSRPACPAVRRRQHGLAFAAYLSSNLGVDILCCMQAVIDDVVPLQWVRPYEKTSFSSQLSAGLRSSSQSRADSAFAGFPVVSPRVHGPEELHAPSESRRFRFAESAAVPLAYHQP